LRASRAIEAATPIRRRKSALPQIRPAYGSRQQDNRFDAAACMNASARPND
jgi:hypothetical protein